MSFESDCDQLRRDLRFIGDRISELVTHHEVNGEGNAQLAPGNIPPTMFENCKANAVLAFRHVEDARMRLGKVLQSLQGGVSILDKPPFADAESE